MPVFYVKKEFLDALKKGIKTAEIRVGASWSRVAEKIINKEIKPIAIFKWRDRVILREIYRVDIYPSIRRALANGRWRKLGLKAKTYEEAIAEISKLYLNKKTGPAVIFWLKKLRVGNTSR